MDRISMIPVFICIALLPCALGARLGIPGEGKIRTDIEYTSDAWADRVDYLPGWGPLDTFNMFAGYITVDKKAGRALFYVLVESENDPLYDPLVMWLNGGPGCSSLGGGFLSELGPFLPNKDGQTLSANSHPWNRIANVLFLESPAFVGWSYSNTSSDRIVGDPRTASDSRQFLLGFMERFPHFRENDLYLSGESYAGHYVPNLAREVIRGNRGATKRSEMLPLRGILVGNPLTDTAIDNLGAVDFWWAHALISTETAEGIKKFCNFSRIGPLDAPLPEHRNPRSNEEHCDDLCNKAFEELGPINIYEIYADVCLSKRARSEAEAFARVLGNHPGAFTARIATKIGQSMINAKGGNGSLKTVKDGQAYDPCVDSEVESYFNIPEVQRALHANQTVILPWRWTDCTEEVQYSREDLLATMLPVYQELIESEELRILVFSGDVDGILPVVGTRRWVEGLGLKQIKVFRPWISKSGQVAGKVIEFEKHVTFASVRNAGHMVPYVQPERMYYLFQRFLYSEKL